MPDLKAAAGMCVIPNESIAYFREILESIKLDLEQDDLTVAMKDELHGIAGHLSLAAQALEALAWQYERKVAVHPAWWDAGDWLCVTRDGYEYYADTPLGALLAAMEGEKNGRD